MSEAGGVASRQGNSRNLKRFFIAVPLVLFLAALVGVPLYFLLRKNLSAQTPCHESLSVPLSNPQFQPDGSVVDGGDVYPSGYHYTANGTTRGCLCSLKTCIRKCCNKDEYYVKVPRTPAKCEKNPGPSSFGNFSVHISSGERVEVGLDHFRILYGDACKHGKYAIGNMQNNPEYKHELLVDGRIQTLHRVIDVSEYCLESINGSEGISTFVCFADQTEDDETKIQLLLYPIAMIVSMPFLIATIVVYTILPALRNLHGKCLVCQCACLLITYIVLAIMQLKGDKLNDFWCIFLPFAVQFTFLASFFWLNVMSFDIWWSFSGLRPAKWGMKASDHKKFLLYSLYAWAVPLLIVATSVAMDMIPGIPDSIPKPGFGKIKCWYFDWAGAFLYFYLPTGIVLALNTAMFVTTACKLRSHAKNDRDQVRYRLYIKLSILMGLNWILEFLSFVVGGPKSIWIVTDLSNSLQGVVIFFLFVCKRDILQKLHKKLCPRWNLFRTTSTDYSKSDSHSKTEVDVLALKALEDSDN